MTLASKIIEVDDYNITLAIGFLYSFTPQISTDLQNVTGDIIRHQFDRTTGIFGKTPPLGHLLIPSGTTIYLYCYNGGTELARTDVS